MTERTPRKRFSPRRDEEQGDRSERTPRRFTPRTEGERSERPYRPRREGEGSDRPYRPAPRHEGENSDRPRRFTPRTEGERSERPYRPRPEGERSERPYRPAPRREGENSDRPRRFTPRTEGERSERPFRPRREGEGSDRPYRPRPEGERSDRPYRPRPEGERSERPFRPRREGEGSDRPYRPRREGEGSDRPYRPRPEGERSDRPFRPRREGEGSDRPYRPRPEGERSDRPYRPRPEGERSDRPYRPRREGEGSDRPYRPRPEGERSDRPYRPKPEGERSERPFRPRREGEGSDRPYRPRREGEGSDRPYREDRSAQRAPRTREAQPKQERERRNPEFVKDEMRLNKFIANSGICSRREADEYIAAGLVTVNGQIVTEMGVKVKSSDDIRFNDERLQGEAKVYIVMNKPKDFVTTTSDPHAEQTVLDLVAGKCTERVYPVGRLDKSTTGVLLITNDGALTEQLTHPSYNRKKIYQVDLDKNLKKTDMEQLVAGIELEDGLAQVDVISYIDENEKKIGLEIHSGRNRIVRRMFEHMGYDVKKLDRVYFAGLTKKKLRRGAWRFLTDQEVAMLKMGSYE